MIKKKTYFKLCVVFVCYNHRDNDYLVSFKKKKTTGRWQEIASQMSIIILEILQTR